MNNLIEKIKARIINCTMVIRYEKCSRIVHELECGIFEVTINGEIGNNEVHNDKHLSIKLEETGELIEHGLSQAEIDELYDYVLNRANDRFRVKEEKNKRENEEAKKIKEVKNKALLDLI